MGEPADADSLPSAIGLVRRAPRVGRARRRRYPAECDRPRVARATGVAGGAAAPGPRVLGALGLNCRRIRGCLRPGPSAALAFGPQLQQESGTPWLDHAACDCVLYRPSALGVGL